MVHVLETGDKTMTVRCPFCGCLFSFEESDMSDDGDYFSPWWTVKCPTCDYKLGGQSARDICVGHYDPIKEFFIKQLIAMKTTRH